MRKTFVINFIFLFMLELIFHITCFEDMSFFNFLLVLSSSVTFSIILAFITSMFKNEKLNGIIMKLIFVITTIIYVAEVIYFKIYESFFGVNGIVFITALKDGYDKIIDTIIENIGVVLVIIVPLIILLIKLPKRNARFQKNELVAFSMVFVVCNLYVLYGINKYNIEDDYSPYNLVNNINMPVLNVKNFGMMASSSLNLKKKLSNFRPKTTTSEDILSNKVTALAASLSVKTNIDNNINFKKLIENESNSTIKEIHEFFYNQEPTNQNRFTGMFKDKNIILIMAESFDEIAINKEITPTLYKLKTEGIVFNNYFSPKYPASTADGQYMLEWGTLPIIGENYSLIDMVYNKNPYLLPRVLKDNGYKTYVYHNYFGYYNRRSKYFSTLNFDKERYCQEGFNLECDRFHGSDLEMMEQSVDDYINQDRFYAYYISLSGHGSYDNSNFIAERHISKLSNYDYPYSIKYYIAANIDFDLAMEHLINKLKQANKLDDTLIVISSDHSPYYLTNNQMNILSSINRDDKFDRNRGSLIIYNSKLDRQYIVDKYAMNIDVLPTMLNMIGIKYDSRIIIGKDIMADNNDGVVIFPDRSWCNNYGCYDATTTKFRPNINNVDQKYITKVTQEVNSKYNVSVNMQYSDYYKYIFN